MTVYLNGRFLPLEDAKISVLDRGFIYGDGVYELIPVYKREPFRMPHHLRRLQRSLDGIRLANPHTDAQWEAIIRKLVAAQPFDDQGVYFQVTRGVAKRDHAFPTGVAPTVFMMSNPLATPSREQVERGVAVVTAEDNRWRRCDLKTISLLGNVLMRQLAADAGAVETVMFRDGYLTEASAVRSPAASPAPCSVTSPIFSSSARPRCRTADPHSAAVRKRLRHREAAVMEHEPGARAPLAVLDLAEEQQVVARLELRVLLALEPRDAAFDQRRARRAETVRHAGEAVGVRP